LAVGCLLPLMVISQEGEPKPLKKVIPAYPEVFKGRGIYGAVHLKLQVDADGSVKTIDVLGGNPIFADASAKAVKQWRYPASGKERTATVSVEFECCYTVRTKP
jgi:TonB family protein